MARDGALEDAAEGQLSLGVAGAAREDGEEASSAGSEEAGRAAHFVNRSKFKKAIRESETWGFWFPEEGSTGGKPFVDVCPRGQFIAEMQVVAQGYICSISAVCSDQALLPRQGELGGTKTILPDRNKSGYTNYSVLAGKTLKKLCVGQHCAGDAQFGQAHRFNCPNGSKLAGYRGRHGGKNGWFHRLAFFCGCPKGLIPKGGKCQEYARGDKDCRWLSWGAWTPCSRGCGSGFRERRRGQIPKQGDGLPCIGRGRQRRTCNRRTCSKTAVVKPAAVEPVGTTTAEPLSTSIMTNVAVKSAPTAAENATAASNSSTETASNSATTTTIGAPPPMSVSAWAPVMMLFGLFLCCLTACVCSCCMGWRLARHAQPTGEDPRKPLKGSEPDPPAEGEQGPSTTEDAPELATADAGQPS